MREGGIGKEGKEKDRGNEGREGGKRKGRREKIMQNEINLNQKI